MNKIFKVIYNKAKHCYVVASEFAKSYTKGGGSRTMRRAAVALLAAAVYTAAGSALANSGGEDVVVSDTQTDYVGVSPSYNVEIDSNVAGNVCGHRETSENVEKASVTVTGGTVNQDVYGGRSNYGIAASNTVNISGGIIGDSSNLNGGNVYGGYSESGSAASNSVNISKNDSNNPTQINGNVYGGRAETTGSASENKVNISGGTFNRDVYGGFSYAGSAASNSVNISGNSTNIQREIYGGYVESGTGSATYNIVTISGGSFYNRIYGGCSEQGSAASNTVNISNVSLESSVYGGYSYLDASSNTVNISNGGKVNNNGCVYGGFSFLNGNVASNCVNINGDSSYLAGDVFGGYSDGSGSAASNSVNISNGAKVSCNAYGGKTRLGNIAASNTVNISSGGKVTQNVYGGWCEEKSIYNKVNIDGGKVSNKVYGGYSDFGNSASNSVNISQSDSNNPTQINGDVYGGYVENGSGSASYNLVTVSGGTVDQDVYGGRSYEGDATINRVNISGGTIKQNVYGGYSCEGDAASNSVTISGGTIGDPSNLDGNVYGGYSTNGNAASNTVNISEIDSNNPTQINGDVYGGYVENGSGSASHNIVTINGGSFSNGNAVFGGYSCEGNAASNTVNISNVSLQSDVYGGYSELDASSNTVNISNGGKVNNNGCVYGGWSNKGYVASNCVNINGDSTYISKDVCGGFSESSASVGSNSVNISNGAIVGCNAYGGKIKIGNIATSNTVNISSGGTVKKDVYGGYSNGNGSVASNSVNISAGKVYQNVYGGYSNGKGSVASNSVSISDGTIGSDGSNYGYIYGGYSKYGNAASNSVNISGGTVNREVYGGYVENGSGSVYENKVRISGGTINGKVFGGWSNSGDAASNSVNISGGNVNHIVYGGYSIGDGSVASNSVNISGGTVDGVYGGYSEGNSSVASNSVTISGATVNQDVYGGFSEAGYAASNSVNINDGTVKQIVYGGYSSSGNAASNSVIISGGTGNFYVYGGYSSSGNATSNSVNISSGTVDGVYGGCSHFGSVASNNVTISGGTINDSVYGGHSYEGYAASNSVSISGDLTQINFNIYGGCVYNGTGSANYNKVNISGGKVNYVYGGLSYSGNAASNSVNISGNSTKIYNIYGGYVASGTGSANYNIVNISGGKGDDVYGGYSVNRLAANNNVNISSGTLKIVYGGFSEAGNVASNSINISGDSTKITNNVYGGFVKSGTGSASCNLVTISGGTINGYVSGGYTNGSSDANENQVTMTGGEILYSDSIENSGRLFGGFSQSGNAASNSVNISGGKAEVVYGGYSDNGSAASNSVNISGETVGQYVYGGYSFGLSASNTVNISGGTVNNVFGGYVYGDTGSASNNLVTISDGTVNYSVYGGLSETGDAASNSVNISGGNICNQSSSSGTVYGGYSGTSAATNNSILISNGNINCFVYGGYSHYGFAASNSVNISGGKVEDTVYGGNSYYGDAASNSVNISGGSINNSVLGGFVILGSTGSANENKVSISGGSINSVCGGYTGSSSGDAASNSVNISGGIIGDPSNLYSNVYGGYSESGSAASNSVNISKNDSNNPTQINGNVYGGRADNTGSTYENKVNISGGTITGRVIGGRSYKGSAASNSVSISGDTTSILGNIYGGVASSTGDANYNRVNISTGTLKIVYGGYSEAGNAASNSINISGNSTKINNVYGGYIISGTGLACHNLVTVCDGNVSGISGGRSDYGDATNNFVNINGGTVKNVYGGYSVNRLAANNNVNISGGTINNVYGGCSNSGNAASNSVNINIGTVKYVHGGYSYDGNVASNSVNISGGTFSLGSKIYSGFVYAPNNSTISDNIVNLGGTVTGLDQADVYGYYFESDSGAHSGNELHIGRTVDYDENGNIKRDTEGKIIYKSDSSTIWQGKTSDGTVNNKVKQVANFESIVLHEVAWNSELSVLAADSFTYDDSTALGGNLTLDITNMTINNANATGSMTLLQSGTADNFRELKLKFSDSEAAVIPDSGEFIKSTATNQIKETNGITLTYDRNQTVFLADSNKKVNYVIFDKYKKAEFGSMDLSEGGYIFSDNDAIDFSDLEISFAGEFNVEGAEDKNEADSIVLIDLSKVMGAGKIKDSIDSTKTLTYDRTPTSASALTISLKQTDEIKTNADRTKLTYTIGTKNITKATFGEDVAWNTSQSYYDAAGSGYTYSSNTAFDASKLKIKFDNTNTALKVNDEMTLIVNASGITNNNAITQPSEGSAYIYTDSNKIEFAATAYGQIETVTDSVQYKVSSIAVDTVDISGWDATNDVSAVPVGWVSNANGVDVKATGFNPTLTDGEKTIITASAGMFKDENIDESIRFAENGSFDNDSDKGITLSGIYTGGVKATDEGKALTYYAISKDVTDINLGTINWGEGRSMDTNANVSFINASKIDAKELKFALSNEQTEKLAKGSSMQLLSNAAGLTAGAKVTYNENAKYHSQAIDYDTANGVLMLGTLSGTVASSKGAVNYTVNGIAIDEINIGNWDDTKDASAVLDGWTSNADGVKVTAETFAPTLKTGEKTIITASADMFKDEKIDESIRYGVSSFENDIDKGVTFAGDKTGGVKASDDGKELKYYAMSKDVTSISLGNMTWGEGRTIDSDSIYDFKNVSSIDATGLKFTNPEIMSGTMDIVDNAKNLGAGIAVTGGSHSQNFDSMLDNKAVVSATLNGEVSVEAEKVKYVLDGISINKFDIANWDGENASSVNTSWKLADDATVETDGMSSLPDSDSEKEVFILKSDTDGYFANVAIKGKNALAQKQFTDSDEPENIVLDITQDIGVTLDSAKKNIVYKVGSKDVTSFKLNTIAWKDGAELLSRDKYNYSKLTTLDTKDFNITFEKPETISVNQSMTLLKANDSLKDIAAIDNSVTYQYAPVSGVTMDAIIRSSLEARSGKVTLTAVSNNADKLTFGNVEWLDKGALIDHKTMLNNVSFDGAAIDTTKIAFTNKEKLDADMQMTLVSDFGGNPGTITGDKYKVGTAYEGEGSAYMDGNDLVFKTKTGAGLSDETHTTVMAMEAGVAMLAAGNEHVGNAIEGLGNAAYMASDGVSTFASVGGSSGRYKTGSHVDTNSWNCTLVVGKNLEKSDGTMEYGLFAEYGRGNYTLHMDGVEDAGSGSSHYTGGGLLMKWTNSHNVYTEASFRMGNMKDNASNILHDGAGNAYGYNVKAKYRGGHIGIGKTYKEDENTKLDIYGKFFYSQREGFNFAAAGDQYTIDDVRSRVLRAGFRLSSTDRKWNRYGGISYDYEFGGQSNGTVNDNEVRSASVKGGTLRGEFGYCREATKTNPWKTDISLFGFTGKRRGVGGSIAFEYHF